MSLKLMLGTEVIYDLMIYYLRFNSLTILMHSIASFTS